MELENNTNIVFTKKYFCNELLDVISVNIYEHSFDIYLKKNNDDNLCIFCDNTLIDLITKKINNIFNQQDHLYFNLLKIKHEFIMVIVHELIPIQIKLNIDKYYIDEIYITPANKFIEKNNENSLLSYITKKETSKINKKISDENFFHYLIKEHLIKPSKINSDEENLDDKNLDEENLDDNNLDEENLDDYLIEEHIIINEKNSDEKNSDEEILNDYLIEENIINNDKNLKKNSDDFLITINNFNDSNAKILNDYYDKIKKEIKNKKCYKNNKTLFLNQEQDNIIIEICLDNLNNFDEIINNINNNCNINFLNNLFNINSINDFLNNKQIDDYLKNIILFYWSTMPPENLFDNINYEIIKKILIYIINFAKQ